MDPRTAWFRHERLGMFIHFGLSAVAADDLSWSMAHKRISSARRKAELLPHFHPDRGGPREWVRMAREAGAKYAVMTVKHHEGFCLWDSALTGYTSTKATRAPRDFAREFVDACADEGIRPGFYYSLIDWDHPDYPADRIHPERDDPGAKERPRDWSRYVAYLHGQVEELLTRYGKIDVLWLDFSYDDMSGERWRAEELVAMVRRLQPEILIDNRLVAGHEDPSKPARYGDFATPEQVVPAEGILDHQGKPMTWESCMTIGSAWGYMRDDRAFKTPEQIVKMLVECVAKGGNLLLNVGPNARGLLRPEESAVLEGLGRWLDLHEESIRGAGPAIVGGSLLPKPSWGWYTMRGNIVYAHLLERPPGPLVLPGLGGKVASARFLHDGSVLNLDRTWNASRDPSVAIANFGAADLPCRPVTTLALTLA